MLPSSGPRRPVSARSIRRITYRRAWKRARPGRSGSATSTRIYRRPSDPNSFRLLEKLGTEPKIYYHSKRDWVREIGNAPHPKENLRG